MGFYPQVSKGDPVKFTAEFHNAVVRTVNAVLGARGAVGGGLARTRTTIPIEASEAIGAGCPVELVGQSDFSYSTRPYLARKARSASSAIGVSRAALNAGQVGSAVVAGLADVSIPDSSTGDYVTFKTNADTTLSFTRTSTQTQWLLIDAQTAAGGSSQEGHILWRALSESVPSTPWAFEATATADPDHPGNFNVSILGGSAQAVGGGTAIAQNASFTNIPNGELFFLRLSIWDTNYEPTLYWHYGNGWDTTGLTCQVEHAQALPTPSGNERWIALVLAKLDTSVAGNIVQYRAGAIDVSATLAAGVAGSGITVRTISTSTP